jgi:hypothetical protein
MADKIDVDKNLLFAVIALQDDLIDQGLGSAAGPPDRRALD